LIAAISVCSVASFAINEKGEESIYDQVKGDDFPQFTIDMDLPPRERFREVVLYFRDELIKTKNAYFADIPKPILWFFRATYWIWNIVHHEKY